MRISELSQASGLPLPTVKYYLREGLLMPGRATSRTRAEYGPEHLERLRLVRALIEHGGVGIAGVRSVLDALAAPPPSRHDFLGVAHCALPTTGDDAEPSPEVTALLERLGWRVWPEAPAARALGAALAAAREAGVGVDEARLQRYAEAMHAVAECDVEHALEATSPEEAMHAVVVGTVMVDPVLVALRRVAQEAVSAQRA